MSLNLLVVDDSSVMRAMIRRCLELSHLPLGEVHEAANGVEGLAALSRCWVDAVLVDINMPVMGGEEMIERMREEPALRDLPVVVISTEGSQTRIDRLVSKGVMFIRKPFRPETIRNVILQVTGEPARCGLDSTLTRIARQAISDLGFLAPADELGAPAAEEAPRCASEVRFTGAVSGTLRLVFERSLLDALARNMLALDEDELLTPEQERDAAREAASVVCGSLLPTLGGTGAVFDLLPTRCELDPPPSPSETDATATARLVFEAGSVDVTLEVDPRGSTRPIEPSNAR